MGTSIMDSKYDFSITKLKRLFEKVIMGEKRVNEIVAETGFCREYLNAEFKLIFGKTLSQMKKQYKANEEMM